MFRFIGVSLVGAVSLLNAGQIQIGGAAGITAAYVGAQPATVGERAYASTLFVGDTENGAVPTFPSGSLTDPNNGVTFSIMNDGGNNYYALSSNGAAVATSSSTITIPVGIFDVADVYTLLNDYYGISGAQNTTVVLNFSATSPTVADPLLKQTFTFTNGVNIRDAIDCTGLSTSPVPGVNATAFPACSGFATATSSPSTSQAFTTAYNGNTNNVSKYYDTAGNLVLDDQTLAVANTFATDYLVNVQVTNSNGGVGTSRDALSAVTVLASPVVNVATPEPASMALFLSGFGGLMFCYKRRRNQ